MKYQHLTPVTDAEVSKGVRALKQGPLTRHDLERIFGSDRRGRQIMAVLTTREIAPVVVTEDNLRGRVYKLAATQEEVDAEVRVLRSRAHQLLRRAEGLEVAWESGVNVPQESLFEAV